MTRVACAQVIQLSQCEMQELEKAKIQPPSPATAPGFVL